MARYHTGGVLKRHFLTWESRKFKICRSRLYPSRAPTERPRRRNEGHARRMGRNPHGGRLHPDTDKLDASSTRGGQGFRKSRPLRGRDAIVEWIQKIRFGRLLINTEVIPFAKRARGALCAIRESRLGRMQIRGKGHKNISERSTRQRNEEKRI